LSIFGDILMIMSCQTVKIIYREQIVINLKILPNSGTIPPATSLQTSILISLQSADYYWYAIILRSVVHYQ